MIIDPPIDWTSQDEANYDFMRMKYKDRDTLGEEWITKRKVAEKNKQADGKPNPHYPRMAMEADIARLMFENSYLVAQVGMMQDQMDIMVGLFQRVGILEGAYQSLALATQTVKVDYHNRLKGYLEKHKPRENPPPPRVRAVGEIVAEDYQQPKEQEDGSAIRTES